MRYALTSLKPAMDAIKKDKINIILALIPIMIGILLYYYLGSFIYENIMFQGQKIIQDYVAEGAFGKFLYYIIATILTIVLYLFISFTFVLVVSFLASPFNDLLSARVERKFLGESNLSLKESFHFISGKISSVIINELKKVFLIVLLSLFAFLLSYIPFLTPIAIFFNVILLAMGFVDYTWSRKNLSFKSCVKDVKSNLLNYSIGGGFFLVLISIPLVNLIVPALATSYFTILWIRTNDYRHQAS